MAAAPSLASLLDSLTQSLLSAVEAAPPEDQVLRPQHGVSLLDVKNELLLSYLQNLVFLILVKLRHAKATGNGRSTGENHFRDDVVKRLAELRLHLEQGVHPLEGKLAHAISTTLRAATESDRATRLTEAESSANNDKKKLRKRAAGKASSDSDSGIESEDDSSTEASEVENDEDALESHGAGLRHLAKNPSELRGMAAAAASADKTGIYRAPKNQRVVMPTTDRRERAERRPIKSATIDEYIAAESSGVPLEEPSVGTTIVARGRKVKTDTERRDETERREYEETNFVRLPQESKKERARKSRIEGRSGKISFGGEEWRELGAGMDRIDQLTKKKQGARGTRALLEKSRKHGRETVDGPRASGGAEIGERFQKRLKVLEGGRRDRGKGR